MKTALKSMLMVGAMVPLLAIADIREDMASFYITLSEVVEKALDEGASIEAIVTEMMSVEPTQTLAIVVAAIRVDPRRTTKIVSTAIAAGANSTEVVRVAIVATNSRKIVARNVQANVRGIQAIVEAAIIADPDNALNIIKSAARVANVDMGTIAAGIKGISPSVDRVISRLEVETPEQTYDPTLTLDDIMVGLRDGVDAVASPST